MWTAEKNVGCPPTLLFEGRQPMQGVGPVGWMGPSLLLVHVSSVRLDGMYLGNDGTKTSSRCLENVSSVAVERSMTWMVGFEKKRICSVSEDERTPSFSMEDFHEIVPAVVDLHFAYRMVRTVHYDPMELSSPKSWYRSRFTEPRSWVSRCGTFKRRAIQTTFTKRELARALSDASSVEPRLIPSTRRILKYHAQHKKSTLYRQHLKLARRRCIGGCTDAPVKDALTSNLEGSKLSMHGISRSRGLLKLIWASLESFANGSVVLPLVAYETATVPIFGIP